MGSARPCPCCGSAGHRPLNGYEKDHLVRCAACRMVFALRRPTEAELQATYGSYPLIPELNPITRQRFLALLDRLEPMRRTGRLLDAGSGSGYFLDTAMERGWEAHGTEYDPAVVEACRKRGIRMQQGLLDPANYEPGSFDAVTSFEVLEHLVEPLRELQHFAALLRPGGQLYLTTPNFNSVSRRLTGAAWNIIAYPEHLNYFTPRTLARALRTAGFARIRIATTGISPMRLRNSVAGATVQANADPTNDDQVLRQRIERNPLLGLAKHGVNAALTLLGAGDTIKVFARKAQ